MTQPTDHAPVRLSPLAALGKLLGLVAALAVAAAVLVVLVLPRAVQGEAMTVLTGSMEPAIPTGSVALVRPVDPRSVAVGDVITYQVRPDEAVYVTHRVVEVSEQEGQTLYTLRGDANNIADDPILGDRIRGEVWFHVPYLGAVRDALHGRGGVYLVATLLLAWFALSQIGAGLRERREARVRPTGAGTAHLVAGRIEPDQLSTAGTDLDDLVDQLHRLGLRDVRIDGEPRSLREPA